MCRKFPSFRINIRNGFRGKHRFLESFRRRKVGRFGSGTHADTDEAAGEVNACAGNNPLFLFERIHGGRGNDDDVRLLAGPKLVLKSAGRVTREISAVSGLLRKLGVNFFYRLGDRSTDEKLELRCGVTGNKQD